MHLHVCILEEDKTNSVLQIRFSPALMYSHVHLFLEQSKSELFYGIGSSIFCQSRENEILFLDRHLVRRFVKDRENSVEVSSA